MTERLRRRLPIGPDAYVRITFWALVLLIVIVFTGAAVRLTGSGLGCPTWPKCTDTSVHSSLEAHGLIEFGNRVLTFLVSAGAAAAALGAYLVRPPRRDLRYLALSLPLGVVLQAVIGGLSVLFKLAPGWVMAHYIVSMVLLTWAFDLWWRAQRPPEEVRQVRADRVTVLAVWVLYGLAAVAIVLGTVSTAAGPHAGASGTGEFVGRLDFWGGDTLRQVIHVHGYVVTALGLGTLAVWWRARTRGTRELSTTLLGVLALLAAQGVVGIVQYQLELPSEIVWLHVALATLTWVGFVHARAAAGALGPARAPAADAAVTALLADDEADAVPDAADVARLASVWPLDAVGPVPEHPEWLRRFVVARDEFLPWIEQTVPLAGRTVLEYGCGQGAVSCATAARAERVIGIDIAADQVRMAREHIARRHLENVDVAAVPVEDVLDRAREHAGSIDVVFLYAVLEHLTIEERLDVLALAREVVRPDGHIVIVESPNRLTAFDHHTAQMPFFHTLPQELAARYYPRAPRADFVAAMDEAAAEGPEALDDALVRFGYGFSFHEAELAFGDLAGHVVAGGYERLLYHSRPVRAEELALAATLEAKRPDLHPAWSRSWIDVILAVTPPAAPPAPVRPWAMRLDADVPGVAVLPDGRFRLAPGARLPVRPHAPTDEIHVGFVATDPRSALTLHARHADLRAAPVEPVSHQAWHAAFDLSAPVAEVELSLRDGGVITYVGVRGGPDPAAPTWRAAGW